MQRPDPDGERFVIVRMYNVGFGDCFLIEFPGAGSNVVRVLVDCGTIASASSIAMPDVVETILQDTLDPDGKSRIDIVVCTHRHADHVSGFADKRWKDLRVSEVWFPWTENPTSTEARRIRDTQSRLAVGLHALWTERLRAAPSVEHEAWQNIALNALSNERAMSMLHTGFASKPFRRFLSAEGAPERVGSDVLPSDVTAYVLGPSKSERTIRDMDPPAGATYLRQMRGEQVGSETFEPFAASWVQSPDEYLARDDSAALVISRKDQERLKAASSEWDPAITVALDKAVNGTSLVLAFESGDAVLLFPGDAQWGKSEAMLKLPETQRLFERLKFWKVGHHGSHNATPVDFVNKHLRPSCCAMMSTKTGKWNSIPRRPLLDAIAAANVPLVRSDEVEGELPPPFVFGPSSIAEAKITVDD